MKYKEGDSVQAQKATRYQIELTEEQLQLISRCMEDCHRFAAGQTDMFYTCLNMKDGTKTRNQLRMLEWGLPKYDWAGRGCEYKPQQQFLAQTYYLYREIRHVLTINNKLDNVFTSETLRCADSGEPITIRRIEE